MKGLLLKDAYMAWKYCRVFLFLIVLFALMQGIATDNFFYIAYPAIFYGMIPIQTVFYDEAFKWHIFGATLPLSRTKQVSSKYVLALCCAGLMTVVTIAFRLLRVIFFFIYQLCTAGMPRYLSTLGDQILYDLDTDTLPITLILPLVILFISTSIELPILFRMGSEKGKVFYQILNGVFCGSIVFLQFADNAVIRTIVTKTYAAPGELANAPSVFSTGILLLLLFVSVTVFTLSWLLSVRFYQKREL